jgi:hypothetical protein
MRRHLKEAEADEKPLQRYACPGCGETYSSMDAANLLDFATGELRCGECRCAGCSRSQCSWHGVELASCCSVPSGSGMQLADEEQ